MGVGVKDDLVKWNLIVENRVWIFVYFKGYLNCVCVVVFVWCNKDK